MYNNLCHWIPKDMNGMNCKSNFSMSTLKLYVQARFLIHNGVLPTSLMDLNLFKRSTSNSSKHIKQIDYFQLPSYIYMCACTNYGSSRHSTQPKRTLELDLLFLKQRDQDQ